MSLFFQLIGDFGSYVNLGEKKNMINELIIKWRVFEPSLHLRFQTVEI